MKPTKKLGLQGVGLGKSFKQRTVVKGVDIGVEPGEIVGLLGPNGAGKTTCFSMMVGLTRADQGGVFLGGHDITLLPLYQRARLGIGYLPQDTSVFRGLTVEQNILAVLELYDRDNRFDILDQLLDEFRLTPLRTSRSDVLSGGERRRLEIARAIAMRPKLLLLDEPFAGVDPIAAGEIRRIIQKLQSWGIGILITDHNVRETLGLVQRAYILADGSVLKEGTPEEIIADEAVRSVYLGQDFRL